MIPGHNLVGYMGLAWRLSRELGATGPFFFGEDGRYWEPILRPGFDAHPRIAWARSLAVPPRAIIFRRCFIWDSGRRRKPRSLSSAAGMNHRARRGVALIRGGGAALPGGLLLGAMHLRGLRWIVDTKR
jgi:hypothetical protein